MARTLACVALAAMLLVIVLASSFDGSPSVELLDTPDAAHAAVPQDEPPAPVALDEVRVPEHYPPEMILASRASTRSGRIAGVVLDGRDGSTPLASADVHLVLLRGSQDEHRVVTGADGRFAIVDVQPGVWGVSVTAESHGKPWSIAVLPRENTGIEVEIVLPVWREMTIQLTGPEGAIRDLRMLGLDEMFTGRVSVRTGPPGVRDARELDRHAFVSNTRQSGYGGSSENMGRFSFGAFVRSNDVVHVVLGERVIASRPLPDDERVAVLPVSPEDVRRAAIPLDVRVVAHGSRRLIAGALVEFRTHASRDPFHVERADAAGVARWNEALPVPWHVRALAHGFVPRARSEGPTREGTMEFELEAGHRLAGRIAAPRKGVTVSLWKRPPDHELLGPTIGWADTDTRGAFDFGTILPGEYVVAALEGKSSDVRGSELAASSTLVLVDLTAREVVDVLVPVDALRDPRTK